MKPAKTKIFLTGATGYIGGTVPQRLRQHPTAHKSEITVLVRNAKKISLLESIGVKTLFGTLDDVALLEQQASKSDVVVACANYNHVRSYKAILRGLKKKHQSTGAVPIFVHTSGTDVVSEDTKGMYLGTAWDDMDVGQLEWLLVDGSPLPTDLLVLEADKQGYVRTYIVAPSTVYGLATGPLVDHGIQNPCTPVIREVVRACIIRRRAGMVGLGLNRESYVHIDDLGDLYMIVYDAIFDGRLGHGLENLCFAENGEISSRATGERIGEVFVEFGLCRPGQETPIPFDETDYARPENKVLKQFGVNSRCIASRARMLGWEPKYTNEELLEHFRLEVQWGLKHKACVN